jgi:hypothetical protein
MGEIPQVEHTYAYLNTAYPCLNEKQLAIGETTFSGPDTLVNEKGMFTIEELERVALMRCDNARDAIKLIGQLVKDYGYGDGGECITIADKNEVWQMEILGEGPDKIGGVWAAKRVPDDHVAVSANISRIGKLERKSNDFMCSDNCEKVAKKYGLWDGKGDFIFYKAFTSDYADGKNFREREYFILNAVAPSLKLSMDMDELPFRDGDIAARGAFHPLRHVRVPRRFGIRANPVELFRIMVSRDFAAAVVVPTAGLAFAVDEHDIVRKTAAALHREAVVAVAAVDEKVLSITIVGERRLVALVMAGRMRTGLHGEKQAVIIVTDA